jgi:hypothetical protein
MVQIEAKYNVAPSAVSLFDACAKWLKVYYKSLTGKHLTETIKEAPLVQRS